MSGFLIVLVIASITAVSLYLAGMLAERLDVPQEAVSGALQFAAGILIGIVAFSLMPPVVRNAPPVLVVLAFFSGGALFVLMQVLAERRQAASSAADTTVQSVGFFIGVLVDMAIDGVAIGIGSTLGLATGVLLGLGMAISTAPLAFVTIATAKRQSVDRARRRQLCLMFVVTTLAGATVGYWGLRDQSEQATLVLIALVSGFLLTMITQTMIPTAGRDATSSRSAIYFVGGLSLFALLTLAVT